MKTVNDLLQELNSISDGWVLTEGCKYSILHEIDSLYEFQNASNEVLITYFKNNSTYIAENKYIKINDNSTISGEQSSTAYDAYISLKWKIRFKVKEYLNYINNM